MARLTTQCVRSFIHSSDPFIHSLVDRVRGLENRFVFKHTHKTWGYKVVHSGYPTHICETEQDFGSPEEVRQQVTWSVMRADSVGYFLRKNYFRSRKPRLPKQLSFGSVRITPPNLRNS